MMNSPFDNRPILPWDDSEYCRRDADLDRTERRIEAQMEAETAGALADSDLGTRRMPCSSRTRLN